MTHSIQLVIIGVIVSIAAYIILRLLRENERLILELDEAKTKVKTLDRDLDEARRSNREAVRVAKNVRMQYKAHRVKHNAVDAEHRKTIQHLYGRIGAMQRQINRLKQYH